jgi:hypothetical protein
MSDKYVYYFKEPPGSAGENTLSTRRATLEAIRGIGEPIMESQIVVDHTELDSNGFVSPQSGSDPSAANDLIAQIGSLELRALSRDSEALYLDDGDDGKDKYMLSMESRELRKQARVLKAQGGAPSAHDHDDAREAPRSDCVEGISSPG